MALNRDGEAEGSLYIDDGETFDYQDGAFIHRHFVFEESTLSSQNIGIDGPQTAQYLKSMENITIGKIVVIYFPPNWKKKDSVKISHHSGEVSFASIRFYEQENGRASYAVVKKPNVGITQTWKIEF